MVAQQLEDGCADLTEVSSVGLMIAVIKSVEPNGLYRCMSTIETTHKYSQRFLNASSHTTSNHTILSTNEDKPVTEQYQN